MNKKLVCQLLICITCCVFFLYGGIKNQNDLCDASLKIPALAKELKTIEEESSHLTFELQKLESPERLIALLKTERYSHLKFPTNTSILHKPEGLALDIREKEDQLHEQSLIQGSKKNRAIFAAQVKH